ncbi:NUDIX domain-containing protein [Planctomycetota bacterium]
MPSESETEYFDTVDSNGTVTGRASRSECHSNPSLIHRAIHILVVNSRSDILLQKRSPAKLIQPGKWDTSVGGHVGAGESVHDAVGRELEEELSIDPASVDLKKLYEYIWESDVETELVTTFTALYEGPVTVQEEEITEARFWGRKEIEETLGSGVFTPNFEYEYNRFQNKE